MATLTRDSALAAAGRAQRGDNTALGRLLRALIQGETHRTYAGNPNNLVTPDSIGQELYDTTNGRWFKSRGASNSSWGLISPAVAVGLISGNGSTIQVVTGFVPDVVEVIDTTNGNLRATWTKDMTAGRGVKIDASSMGLIGAGLGISQVTTAGSEGFQIGNTVSVAAAQLQYIATKRQ